MAQANIKAVITAEDRASGTLDKFGSSVDGVASNMKKVAVGMAAVGAGVTLFAKNALDDTVEFTKESKILAQQIGGTAEEASRLIFAGKQLGLTAQDASVTFGIFSKKIVESRDKTGEAALAQADLKNKIEKTEAKIRDATEEIKKNGDKTGDLQRQIEGLNVDLSQYRKSLTETTGPLDKLKISTTNAKGESKTFHEILLDVADRFKEMPNGIDKTALSMELFGRSGKDLIPLLNQGSQGIAELEKQADKLGITLTEKNLGQINEYIAAQKNLTASTDALKMSIGLATAPVMTDFNTQLNQMILNLINSEGPVSTATVSFLAFGGPVLSATAAVVGFGASLVQIWPALFGTAENIGLVTKAGQTLAVFLMSPIAPVVFLAAGIAAVAQMYNLVAFDLIPQLRSLRSILDQEQQIIDRYKSKVIDAINAGDRLKAQQSAVDLYKAQQNQANGGLQFRALGGPVAGQTAYIVGEQGPELFIPKSSGSIVPNNKLGVSSAANTTVNVTFSGIFTGDESEFRKLALKVFQSASDAAGAKNMKLGEMF